jgi:hypothetical protein
MQICHQKIKRSFDLAEANRKAAVQSKIAEENRAAARKLEEEEEQKQQN